MLAKVDMKNGNLDTTYTQSTGPGPSYAWINSMTYGNSSLYVGGTSMTTYRRATIQNLFKIDPTNGNLDTTFTQTKGLSFGQARSLLIYGGSLYLGGFTISYRGNPINARVLKLDPNSGVLDTGFDGSGVAFASGLVASGGSIYPAGTNLVKFDLKTGIGDPTFASGASLDNPIFSMAFANNTLCLGGTFT